MGTRAIAIHQVQLCGLVALVTIVVASVGDEFPIGRDDGRIVGALAIGERAKGAVSDAELVDFGIKIFVIGFGMTVDGDDEVFAVGRPGSAGRTELVATVREVAVGDLTRGSAFAVNNEDLHVAGLQIARAIKAVDQAVVGGGRIGPLCPGGWGGQVGEVRAFARNKS